MRENWSDKSRRVTVCHIYFPISRFTPFSSSSLLLPYNHPPCHYTTTQRFNPLPPPSIWYINIMLRSASRVMHILPLRNLQHSVQPRHTHVYQNIVHKVTKWYSNKRFPCLHLWRCTDYPTKRVLTKRFNKEKFVKILELLLGFEVKSPRIPVRDGSYYATLKPAI